jgi:hypothetical protein
MVSGLMLCLMEGKHVFTIYSLTALLQSYVLYIWHMNDMCNFYLYIDNIFYLWKTNLKDKCIFINSMSIPLSYFQPTC